MKCPHCGQSSDKRSSPQHRRMFKIFGLAYDAWPERAKFQPENADHLRAWLACKAKYIVTEELLDSWPVAAKDAVVRQFKRDRPHMWRFRQDGIAGEILLGPKSMAFDTLKHKEACALFKDIEDIICAVIGISDCEELLTEHKRAA